jgi:hypothetical protein
MSEPKFSATVRSEMIALYRTGDYVDIRLWLTPAEAQELIDVLCRALAEIEGESDGED